MMSGSNPQYEWVTIAHANNRMEAEVIGGLLRSENIPVFIRQEGAGQAIGIYVGILGLVDVMVPSQYEELAISLLDKKHQFDSPFGK